MAEWVFSINYELFAYLIPPSPSSQYEPFMKMKEKCMLNILQVKSCWCFPFFISVTDFGTLIQGWEHANLYTIT